MLNLDPADTKSSINRLRRARKSADIFGALGHKFVLNPPLPEADGLAFERRHAIELPADYRHFLTSIGNGGAGPYYGVFPLGHMDSGNGPRPWREQGGLIENGCIGTLSQPFPFDDAWNDLSGMPPDDLLESDEAEYERRMSEFEKRYWSASLMNGAIPICHEGCALRVWLVITGKQRGHLWRDTRSGYTGVTPMRTGDGILLTFSRWYREWLDAALQLISK